MFAGPARLRRLQIEITTGCNLRCAGCQRTLGMAAGTWRNAHMPIERFARVLANAPAADALILQGIGEPTLHPALPEMIALARGTGRFGVISFNTNALARETAYYADLRGAGLGHVSISVDSLNADTAEALRAGTDTARLREAVCELTAMFQRSVTLSVVLSRRNLPELADLLAGLHAIGGRIVEIQPLVSYAPAIDPLALTEADRRAALATIAAVRARLPDLTVLAAAALTPDGSRCRRPFHAAYVTVGGFLTPCCLTNDPDLMGRVNLGEMSFEQAWQTAGVRRFMARYFDREPAICHGCAFNPSGAQAPDFADATLARAEAALREGDLPSAADNFRRIAADRVTAEAIHGLGLTHLMAGSAGDAEPLLRAARALAPGARVTHNLAMALEKTGNQAEAISLERANIGAHPEYVPSWHGLSAALDAIGERHAAAGVELTLAERAAAGGNAAIAATASARASMLDPAHPALPRVANRLRIAGQTAAALHLLDARLARDPDDHGARLSRAMARLTVIHATETEIAERRTAYLADLTDLDARLRQTSPDALARAAEQVGTAKPFYLAYQGQDDTEAQRLYGRIISRMMDALPVPAAAAPARAARPGAPIRVGFATAYFHLHSVSKLFGGWMRHLDRSRFEVFGYHLGEAEDATSAELARHCKRFHRGPRAEADWIGSMRGDRLDVLIYPEIGMHPMPVRLACHRLAPVQCVAWGHPVTTGLPTIDYFLSSALMEPDDADRHYTETLVRLPNLSIQYEPPAPETGTLTRNGLGLDAEAVVYLCCQSLFKYHPGDDAILPAIARRVPRARFLFIGTPGSDPNARRLLDRLSAVFAAAGLDPNRHLVFTPPVPAAEFPALLRAADIYLDTPRWSGGNTTLEALAAGLPIVTLPGAMMRGRHSAAILLAAGAEKWIAWSEDHYVELAASLADPAERARARGVVLAGRTRVFGDAAALRGLEDFLTDPVSLTPGGMAPGDMTPGGMTPGGMTPGGTAEIGTRRARALA